MFNAEHIAQIIGGRRIGEGRYRGKCPVHGKEHFYVTDGEQGTMMYCHAGATFSELCESLGIKPTDCFPGKYTPPPYDPSNDMTTLTLAVADLKKGKSLSASDIDFVKKAKRRLKENNNWRNAVEFAKSC